jgi:hypothetical protein
MGTTVTAKAGGKPVRGRPKKFIDLELVEKLAHIQCTHAEIAATLGVSIDTLQRNKDFPGYLKGDPKGDESPYGACSSSLQTGATW